MRALAGSIVRFLSRRRRFLTAVIAGAAMVAGLALSVAAFVPDIEFVRSETLEGSLSPASRVNLSFVRYADVIELRLTVGNCSIFVTALDEAQSDRYNASGVQPSPQLGCATPNASFNFPLHTLVVENRGPGAEPYAIAVRYFSILATRAYLAIPALPLVLVGGTYLALRSLLRGVQRIREDLL